MSNIVMALTVMITLLFLMPLFAYTPNVVLAAIIIVAESFHLSPRGACHRGCLWIFRILIQTTRTRIVELGNILGTNIHIDIHQYGDAKGVPGFLIIAIGAPINFLNTTYLKERYLLYT
ncbi:hypothetical protein ZIOFF_050550 [Zingiber officinale]|uniref:SLC26A/SulP transporter domain-containing protein n=1 Tax=Zingiber officinale TaxID=94328 RepID=A0A8J5FRS8_ZINOF|nr:hypothetical protein ZIOFF_050550 [Zingiber officinale]